jgi:hypothetical protein
MFEKINRIAIILVIFINFRSLFDVMKNKTFTFIALTFISLSALVSCNKDQKAAETVVGNYTGSFEGTYLGNDSLTSVGYQVAVSVINDNKIKIQGANFEPFEVLVTSNGLNVEPVSQSDPYLKKFLYIGDDKKLQFVYNKGANTASFIGTK